MLIPQWFLTVVSWMIVVGGTLAVLALVVHLIDRALTYILKSVGAWKLFVDYLFDRKEYAEWKRMTEEARAEYFTRLRGGLGTGETK